MLSPARGPRGSLAFHSSRRPWKRRRLWTRSLEEPSGVRGAECGDSHQGNKVDLTGSRVHTPRKAWHKHVAAKTKPVPREKSEGDILLWMVRTTEPHRREGPLLQRCRAGRDVMVHARQSQPHPREKSRDLQRRLYLAARGVGAVGSTLCMTASSGPTYCGGPGKKCEPTEGAPASMGSGSKMWDAAGATRSSRGLWRA